MMFAALGQNYPEVSSQLYGFGKGQLAYFWEQIAQSRDEKLKGHPMQSLVKDWQKKTIPLFIHGDGVDYANDSLLVFGFGCLASNLSTLPNHFLMACHPKSCGTKETWKTIWHHLSCSLKALACGRHPTENPGGKHVEKGSIFFQ